MIIRDATRADLGAIGGIWNHYIQTTAYNWRLTAYSPAELQTWFDGHDSPMHPVLVAEEEGTIVGFGALSTFRASAGYRFTAEDTIYLAPGYTGRGIGRLLMEALIKQGSDAALAHVIAMVDSHNTASLAFHRRMGFEQVGLLRDVGKKNGENLSCVVMQRRL